MIVFRALTNDSNEQDNRISSRYFRTSFGFFSMALVYFHQIRIRRRIVSWYFFKKLVFRLLFFLFLSRFWKINVLSSSSLNDCLSIFYFFVRFFFLSLFPSFACFFSFHFSSYFLFRSSIDRLKQHEVRLAYECVCFL